MLDHVVVIFATLILPSSIRMSEWILLGQICYAVVSGIGT